MPVLKKIVVQDFRNIALQELVFSPNINCISGNNGEGKTNLIDAIYYLSMTKSALGASDRFNFRYGTDAFAIAGSYMMPNGLESRFSVSVTSDGEKKVKRDDKPYKRVSEHVGVLPIVLVSPSDISMVSESGEERRRFMNAVLSQMEHAYLDNVQQYNRYLLQRNRLLKSPDPDPDLMDAFDARLSALAAPIAEGRRSLAEALAPVVQAYYTELSGGREEVGIEYRTDADRGELAVQLKACRDRDRALKYTTVGVQRDDFLFTMNGYPIRKCGSQGQQKSFLVSLKFAQYEIMKESYGFAPILLLDDLFDKLDFERTTNLLKMVASKDFGQIFITDTDKSRLESIVDGITEESAFYQAEGGVFTRQ